MQNFPELPEQHFAAALEFAYNLSHAKHFQDLAPNSGRVFSEPNAVTW